MKIQMVAQTPEQTRAFLCEDAGVLFIGPIEQTSVVRRWHDDVWEDVHRRSDLGEIWNVYTAELRDDCQDHIKDFSGYQFLEEDYLYILSRSFCALCNKSHDPASETEYIIA
ncbi:hypothetical protein [Bacteroides sp.]|uniref:hypothetical protein n=1 Tax=Bacteroides sp. TaxID=29523 RepID=UPI002616EE3A|nr:hypothetical protein [Bacteroides sp.]MDD3040988.1 hypothetical protein [Bacteroides sp.]